MEEQRRLINPFEMLVLIIGIGVVLYIIYQNDGVDIVKKTEQVEIIDNPQTSSRFQAEPKTPSREEQEIDRVLTALAQQFSSSSDTYAPKATQDKWQRLGLTKDEVAFYKKINDTYKFDDKIKNTQDWLAVLQTANSTYSKVKSLLQNTNRPDESSANELTEKGIPQSLSFKMKKLFKLSEEELQNFAQKGDRSISDWAAFILENQQ